MSLDYPALIDELRYETNLLLEHLRPLTSQQWDLATPAAGWSIKDQIGHLAFFDDMTLLALTKPERFEVQAKAQIAGGMDFPDRIADQHRVLCAEAVLNWFGDSRRELLETYSRDTPKRRVPWYGPEMSVASSTTARLMETWAHGQDIYDTLSVEHPNTPGLHSIAHLGVATFAFSHRLHGLDVPAEPVRVELTAPNGELWTWGPPGGSSRVTGPARDFVLAVTQRRHWSETELVAENSVARGWLDIAQAFAGAPSRRQPKVLR